MSHVRQLRFDLLLAVLLLFPIFGWPIDLLGASSVDVWNHAWGPWWWAHSFSNGELPWHTNLLQGPDGGTLWFIDPILALLGAPFALFSPSLGFAFALLIYFGFASFGIRYFARTMGAGEKTQWVASVGFVCSAWVLSEAQNGITEALNIGPVAFALGMIAAADKAPTFKNWGLAGAAIGFTGACSPYLGLGTGITAIIFGLKHIKRSWFGAIVAGIIASPTLFFFRLQLNASDAIIKRPAGMNETLALHNAVDPRTFIAPFGFQSVDLSNEGFVHSLYFGMLLVVLMLPVLWKRKMWMTAMVVSLLCALGPYLYWNDNWFVANASRFRLPWYYLQSLFPGLAVTHPLRLGIPAFAICCACAAVGLEQSKWRERWKLVTLLVLIDGLFVSGAPFPIETSSSTIPMVYDAVKKDPRETMVLDLPTDAGSTMKTSQYLFFQTFHHKSIPYAPDARASTSSLLRYSAFRELAALCNRRADEHQRLGFGGPKQMETDLWTLNEAGVGWIVLHPDMDPDISAQLYERIVRDLGPPTINGEQFGWRLDDRTKP